MIINIILWHHINEETKERGIFTSRLQAIVFIQANSALHTILAATLLVPQFSVMKRFSQRESMWFSSTILPKKQ